MSLARYLQHVQGGDGFSPHIFDEHFAKYANEGYAAPVEPTAEAVPPPVPYGDITARQAEDFGVVMVDRDVLARIMRAVEEVERRKGLSVPPSLNSVYASEGGGWPGVTTDDGELVRMPSRLDLDYGTKMPPMMLPSDFERVMAPIYPGFRPVHGAGDSGGNERSDDAPKASAALAAAGPAASSASTVTAAGASSVPSSSSSTLPDASSSMTSMGGGDPDNFKHTQEDYDLVEELGLKDLVDDELQGLTGDDYKKRWDDLKTMMLTAREFPDSQEAVALESKNAERFIRSLIGAVAGSARTVMGAVAGGIAGRIAPEMMTLGAKIDEDKRAEAMKKILDSIPRFGDPTTFADDVRSAVINMELQGLTGGDTSTTISEIYRIRDLIDKNKDSPLRYQLAADLVYKVEVMTTPGNVLLSLYEGGKAVPAKVASWVRESVGSCASGVGKTLKRDEMARVVAAMYPDLPAEFLQKAAKPSLCLLLGDEIVGRTISGLCRQGLAGGPDTQRRLIEIVSTLTQQPAASLVALPRDALCSLAANASSTKQRAGAMHAAKLLDPLAGVDWSKVGAQASSALSAAARGGRAAFDASKVIGEQLYDGTNAVLQSPVTRAAARMAGQAAMAGGRMAGQAAMAGGRMAGRAAMDAVAPPPFEIHGVMQHRAYQVALDSAHRMRSDRIASAMNPYTGVERGKAPKVSRAMRGDGNPYVGYGNAGYLGSKTKSTVTYGVTHPPATTPPVRDPVKENMIRDYYAAIQNLWKAEHYADITQTQMRRKFKGSQAYKDALLEYSNALETLEQWKFELEGIKDEFTEAGIDLDDAGLIDYKIIKAAKENIFKNPERRDEIIAKLGDASDVDPAQLARIVSDIDDRLFEDANKSRSNLAASKIKAAARGHLTRKKRDTIFARQRFEKSEVEYEKIQKAYDAKIEQLKESGIPYEVIEKAAGTLNYLVGIEDKNERDRFANNIIKDLAEEHGIEFTPLFKSATSLWAANKFVHEAYKRHDEAKRADYVARNVDKIPGATKIQTAFRRMSAQKKFAALKEATTKLQSVVRGGLARKKFAELREEARKKADAATKLQTLFRGLRARKTLTALREEARKKAEAAKEPQAFTEQDVRNLAKEAQKQARDVIGYATMGHEQKQALLKETIEKLAREANIVTDGIYRAAIDLNSRGKGSASGTTIVPVPVPSGDAGTIVAADAEAVKDGEEEGDEEGDAGRREEDGGRARQARYTRSGRKHRAKSASAKKPSVRVAASKRKHRAKSASAKKPSARVAASKRKHRAKSAPSSGSSSRQRCSHSLGANAVLCA
eukprot:jgi/Mesvir1/9559/Mv08983-RA.1